MRAGNVADVSLQRLPGALAHGCGIDEAGFRESLDVQPVLIRKPCELADCEIERCERFALVLDDRRRMIGQWVAEKALYDELATPRW